MIMTVSGGWKVFWGVQGVIYPLGVLRYFQWNGNGVTVAG
jgi:hypothetical protein